LRSNTGRQNRMDGPTTASLRGPYRTVIATNVLVTGTTRLLQTAKQW